jgi:hypothetical protein
MPSTPLFPLPEGLAHYLCERHTRRGSSEGDLSSDNLSLSTLFDPLLGHSQLVPQETPGSSVCRSSQSAAAFGEKVLLSPSSVTPQNLSGETARSDRGFVTTHETLAQHGARERRCHVRQRGRAPGCEARHSHLRRDPALVLVSGSPSSYREGRSYRH